MNVEAAPTSNVQRKIYYLAHLCGIQTLFKNYLGKRSNVPFATVVSALKELGQPLAQDFGNVDSLIEKICCEKLTTVIDCVNIVWLPENSPIKITLPANIKTKELICKLTNDAGYELIWQVPTAQIKKHKKICYQKHNYWQCLLTLPSQTKPGYYDLEITIAQQQYTSYILVAPLTSYTADEYTQQRHWGCFAPTYALRSENNFGAGDISDLIELSNWLYHNFGAHILGTLPLHPAFLELDEQQGCCYSPYMPISRLLWNEFFLDIKAIPELNLCQEVKDHLNSPEFLTQIASLRAKDLVAYSEVAKLKTELLRKISNKFFELKPQQSYIDFSTFIQSQAEVKAYAEFRARQIYNKQPWTAWSQDDRKYAEEDFNYHLFVQWQCHRQLNKLKKTLQANNCRLYLDLPLGVTPDGYDSYMYRNSFAANFYLGAPPDAGFRSGQNWGFPPLHPQRIRHNKYNYFIKALRHEMQYANILRLDHILGFHRLFWIPQNQPCKNGLYVKYNAAEFYAIINIESHLSKTVIVGEDLGLVPSYIPRAMDRHNLHHFYVLQYSFTYNWDNPITLPPPNSLSGLNTHDMPPFSAFLAKLDIEDQYNLGWIDQHEKQEQERQRNEQISSLLHFFQKNNRLTHHYDTLDIITAALKYLSEQQARFLLINLEDLWAETEPQNVPGTYRERPNWQRKFRLSLTAMQHHERLNWMIGHITSCRRK